jgi:hypothetical protein
MGRGVKIASGCRKRRMESLFMACVATHLGRVKALCYYFNVLFGAECVENVKCLQSQHILRKLLSKES